MTIDPSPSRRRIVLAGRVTAGLAISAATLTMFGGSALASDEDPIAPTPGPAFDPVSEPVLEPVFELAPVDSLDFPELPELPGEDGPTLTIPDDIFIPGEDLPEIPDIPELPLCAAWNPADVAVASVDNGDLTATVTLVYSGPDGVCDELFVVHSTQEDAALNPLALLAEEQVTLTELVADDDNTIAVDVPLDPCYTRVFTHGPEALVMQDDHYGDGCPDPTTTTAPPVETTDPTVAPTTLQTPVPGGTLPETGSSSTVIALIGAALVLAGGCLAIGVRTSQTAA